MFRIYKPLHPECERVNCDMRLLLALVGLRFLVPASFNSVIAGEDLWIWTSKYQCLSGRVYSTEPSPPRR